MTLREYYLLTVDHGSGFSRDQVARHYGYPSHAAYQDAIEATKRRAQRDNAEWRQRQREQRWQRVKNYLLEHLR